MSMLSATPGFNGCCGGLAPSIPVANPNMYYDITRSASPNAIGLLPAIASLPAACFEVNGNGPSFIWNPATGTWN